MKVGIVCPYEWTVPGGVKSHVQHLAAALRAGGTQVDVLAPAEQEVDEPHFVSLGGSLPIPYNGSVARIAMGPRTIRQVRTALKDGGYDLVHVHEPISPSVGLIAVYQSQAPVVGTMHANLDRSAALRLGTPVLRRAFSRLAARIAVSASARDTFQRYFGGPMVVVPNGVPEAFFAPAEPVAGLEGGGQVILFVGRLEPRKGLDYLVRAWLLLKADLPGLRLVVVGGDSGRGQERAMAMVPPRLRPDLLFVGFVPDSDLRAYLRSADVLCAPSLGGESFGIVLVEAMAAGVPVVCSDISGYRDVVGDGVVVPPRDPQALAAALAGVLGDPERRSALADAGRVTAARYAWGVVADEVMAVYRSVLG